MYKAVFLSCLAFCYGQAPEKQEQLSRQLLHYQPPGSVSINPQPALNPFAQQAGNGYPSLEQQFLIYQGGQQPFLLQPNAPPGNFLIPQPQPQPHPGFVFRDLPQNPGRFFPGAPQQPRPAFTPPINKDAEEIPTNPAQIPPFRSQDLKPEKLETFDEKPSTRPEIEEQEPHQPAYPRSALFPQPESGLRPGQRFFILNGQPLFSNYPIHPAFAQPNTRLFYPQPQQQEFSKVPPPPAQNHHQQSNFPNQAAIDELFLRNAVTGQIANVSPNFNFNGYAFNAPQQQPEQNLISLNQPFFDYNRQLQHPLFRFTLPTGLQQEIVHNKEPNVKPKGALKPIVVQDEDRDEARVKGSKNKEETYFRYEPAKLDKREKEDENEHEDDAESVIIDAKFEEDADNDTEVVSAQNDEEASRKEESSVAQSQPQAIALAGVGGVATSGPRATALVGDGGLAVSNPKATAVAGPREDDKKNKNKGKKPK